MKPQIWLFLPDIQIFKILKYMSLNNFTAKALFKKLVKKEHTVFTTMRTLQTTMCGLSFEMFKSTQI